MADHSNIEWTDSTFNPWEGCTKVSPGCDNCYAENRNARFAGGAAINWGAGVPRRRTSAGNWQKPVTWNAKADEFFREHGRRRRVFCASLADVFDNEVPDEWRADLFTLIRSTPKLEWLLLTKRIGNAQRMIEQALRDQGEVDDERAGWPWGNVRIGASIVDQEEAERDIAKLLRLGLPNFLSMEPLLAGVDLTKVWVPNNLLRNMVPALGKIDWVIVGGESGPGARPMHPEWVRSLRDQCEAAGVPFLFKQWGEWKPISQMDEAEHRQLYVSKVKAEQHEDQCNIDDIYGRRCTVPYTVVHLDGSMHGITEQDAFIEGAMQTFKVGKKAAGRLLDGRTWDGFPVP